MTPQDADVALDWPEPADRLWHGLEPGLQGADQRERVLLLELAVLGQVRPAQHGRQCQPLHDERHQDDAERHDDQLVAVGE